MAMAVLVIWGENDAKIVNGPAGGFNDTTRHPVLIRHANTGIICDLQAISIGPAPWTFP